MSIKITSERAANELYVLLRRMPLFLLTMIPVLAIAFALLPAFLDQTIERDRAAQEAYEKFQLRTALRYDPLYSAASAYVKCSCSDEEELSCESSQNTLEKEHLEFRKIRISLITEAQTHGQLSQFSDTLEYINAIVDDLKKPIGAFAGQNSCLLSSGHLEDLEQTMITGSPPSRKN